MNPQLVFPIIGLLLAALGWPLATRRVRPNRWYGLRIPATLTDPAVWYAANAVAGRDMIGLGTTLMLAAVALPRAMVLSEVAYSRLCAGILVVGSIVLVLRGWRIANRLARDRRGKPAAREP